MLSASTRDTEFLDGLRARGLYWLAEKQILGQPLAENSTSDARASRTIELAKTYAEWAVASPPGERSMLWEKAHKVTAEFTRSEPNHPKRLLVDLQDALTWLAAGELERLEATGVSDSNRFELAKEHLRQAIRGMTDVVEQTKTLLRQVRLSRTEPSEDGWSAAELEGLERHVAIELARALQNQALCYPSGSEDHVNALTRALEQLAQPGVAIGQDLLSWRARLVRIACLRLLGHGDACRQEMQALLETKPPDWVTLCIEANRVQLLVSEGDLTEARAAIQKGRSRHGLVSQQLDFAHLDVYLALWQAAHHPADPTELDSLSSRILDQVRLIGNEYGPAAGRRAEMQVGRLFASTDVVQRGGSDLDALRIAAESLYRAGKISEAIAAYDQAAGAARKIGDADRRFQFGFTAAALEQKMDQLQVACDRYCRLAETMPQHPNAARAHRMAILCASGLVRRAEGPAARSGAEERYTALLQNHLSNWPNSPTANDARFWYGQWLENQRSWREAIAMYQSIPPDSEHFPRGLNCVCDLYERLLKENLDRNFRIQCVQEATQFLQPLIAGPDKTWPSPWTPLQRSIALSLGRMHIRYAEDGAEYCREILTAALAGSNEVDSAWKATARALLAEALLIQGAIHEADELAKQLPDGHLPMVELVEQSRKILHQSTGHEKKAAVAQFVLHLVERFGHERNGFSAADRFLLDRARAAAHDVLGHYDEALALYTQLVKQRPKDGDLREDQARLLSQTGGAKDWNTALRAWQAVEHGSKPGGPRWFRARYARCELLIRLGRRDEAMTLIRLTTAIYPDLGGDRMRESFRKLVDH
ncbi:MAG: tetratricopeptide repeat protein [Pirellulales bacterium]|nr:tetratricopeptide repeat protein [Pirellulales bacterium]